MRDVGVILKATFDTFLAKLNADKNFKVPKQQFIQTGDLAWDCESLSVSTIGFYQGLPGQQRPGYQSATGGYAMYAMDVGVSVLRPAPKSANNGMAPTGQVLTAASLNATSDAKSLTDAYWASIEDDSLASVCDTIYFGGVQWVGPQGGFLATSLTFSTQI